MKYLTKEYYDLVEKSCLQLEVVPSPSAKRKSENYFRHLYGEKLKNWLDVHHQIAEKKGQPFDGDAAAAEFEEWFQQQQKRYTELLPEEIVSQAADLRVLALGTCTGKVKQLINKFSKENMARADEIEKKFDDYKERRYRHIPEEIVENFGFLYARVTDLIKDGGDLRMKIDNTSPVDAICEIWWKNASILEEEADVVGSSWVDNELYQVPGGGYEFHMLLDTPQQGLAYFTVKADDVEFLYDEEKRKRILEESAIEDEFDQEEEL